jgi:hypothetical protein
MFTRVKTPRVKTPKGRDVRLPYGLGRSFGISVNIGKTAIYTTHASEGYVGRKLVSLARYFPKATSFTVTTPQAAKVFA